MSSTRVLSVPFTLVNKNELKIHIGSLMGRSELTTGYQGFASPEQRARDATSYSLTDQRIQMRYARYITIFSPTYEREREREERRTHSTHFIYGYMASYMVKDQSDSERGNLLPPHGLLFPISR